MMKFTVSRSSGVSVQPSEATPSGTVHLSRIDNLPVVQMDVHTLHVFREGGHQAAKVVKEALSKALVLYYPLAGRYRDSSRRQVIDCTGQGVWFVEAFTHTTLQSVDYFDDVLSVPKEQLLPPHDNSNIDPLVKIQLTSFSCGGFVIALKTCHSVMDGIGAAGFLIAVGEFARGFVQPNIAPVWQRERIPNNGFEISTPPAAAAPPPMPTYQLEHATIDISPHQINKHKKDFLESTGNYCSSFDVVVASLWRYRTRVIKLKQDTNVDLVFAVNTRNLLDPPLPQGYYGNCFYPVKARSSSRWLEEASNVEVVQLIKDAKARVPKEFTKWLKKEEESDPFAFSLAYTTLCVSEWGHLGFNQVDYGWGHPVRIVPLQDLHVVPNATVGLPPTPNKGVRLSTWCVTKEHLPFLLHHMKHLSTA